MSGHPRSLAVAVAVAALSLSYAALGAARHDPVQSVVSVPDADTLRIPEHGRVRFGTTPEIVNRARCPRGGAKAVEVHDHVHALIPGPFLPCERQPGERDRDDHGRPIRRVSAADGGDIEA